jgi:DNA invertase Pin-like site-specific DNA recombinase
MIATGYVRRSTKSEETTVSLPDQALAIERYCTSKGLTLSAIVAHDGVSGGERYRFDDINSVLTATGSEALVFGYLDRLARDSAGLLQNAEELTKRGIEIHETTQGRIDTKDPTQKLMLAVRSAMDENYKNVIQFKTRRALQYKKENGQRYTNLPPLGYSYQNGKLIEDAEEQRALSIIAACHQRGLGARKTRTVLVQAGYKGRMGLTTIHRTLQLPNIKDKLPANYFSTL